MGGFAHLEVRSTNRTPSNEATGSKVREYVRTWSAKQLITKLIQFQVRVVLHTWKKRDAIRFRGTVLPERENVVIHRAEEQPYYLLRQVMNNKADTKK